MSNILDTVKVFFSRYKINLNKDVILLALSGGYDSMCLLHILKNLGAKNIIAIHFNHNWRGEDSYKDELRCKDFCELIGVKFYSETVSEYVKKSETAAREARYNFFIKCANMFNSKIVLTAHNANDNAETVIYRIVKGTGINGLSGILPKRDIFYRPLLTVFREDIECYCNLNSLKPNIDVSNSDTKYNRNLIRHKVLPILQSINKDVIYAINKLSYIAWDYNTFIKNIANGVNNSTQAFINTENVVKYHIIKEHLLSKGIDYDSYKIENILNFIEKSAKLKSGKTFSLSNNLFLFVNSSYFEIFEKSEKLSDEYNISEPGCYVFGNFEFVVEECKKNPKYFPKDTDKKVYIYCDNLDFTIRTRRDGDVISPLGLGGSQKLKKYLNEKKIPQYKKDKIPLLCKGNEIFWVVGYGLSEKIKVKTQPTHVIYINERVGSYE